MTGFRC